MTPIFSNPCTHFPIAEISGLQGVYHHAQFIWPWELNQGSHVCWEEFTTRAGPLAPLFFPSSSAPLYQEIERVLEQDRVRMTTSEDLLQLTHS